MRDLVEVSVGDGRIAAVEAAAGRRASGGRRVTVNRMESPLAWLRARGLVDARQFEAGERLRGDYERAQLAPSVTMRWDTGARGTGERLDATEAQIAARQRFHHALDPLGPGLTDIVWRVVCAGEGLPVAEKGLGWPTRSGRLVLGLALDRLADAYRLP